MRVKLKAILFLLLLVSMLPLFTEAQIKPPKGKWEPEDAEEHFKNYNFVMALPMFKELVKREPMETNYLYKLAICYLRTWVDKPAAIPHLEKA